MTFPQTEESLKNLYRFVVFYRHLICILKTVFSTEENYYENSHLESDYVWLVTKIEKVVKEQEFNFFSLLNDFDSIIYSTLCKEALSACGEFVSNQKLSYQMGSKYHLYKPLIPLYSLEILNNEAANERVFTFFNNYDLISNLETVYQFYNRIFIENDKKIYQLSEEEQKILIESHCHLLAYAEQISKRKTEKLEQKINQLEEVQKEQSIERFFQSSFRLIEEFIEDSHLKNIVREDLNSARFCFTNGAYKATVLLCGGIIEAILKEAIASGKNSKPIEREFLAIINSSDQEGIIKQITADLSHVTRVYRNTTHIDTQKSVGLIEESDASIAIKTLKNVCDDVLDWYKRIKA
ncbi:hypothetical protein SD81_028010 [Tolypothrix campylonemoides VB511288]|nr:hypothetical protein SD81_028010 [Tolypothrix campylonemoides VB511288]